MTSPTDVPTVSLRAGGGTIPMPQLGFGVFKVPAEQVVDAVATALQVGYRSIDTAKLYANEEGVGQAVRESGLAREDVFVTTKVWNDEQGYDESLRAFDASSQRLGMDVVDLYLIHWPCPEQDKYVDTWKALLKLREDGRIRAAGVCNFQPRHLQRLIDETGEAPAINQVELNPTFQQEEVRAFNAQHEILTEAWAPLAQGRDVLQDETIAQIGRRLGKTPAQVILRWHLQIGNVVIPKSVTPSRIEENFQLFDFELTDDDLQAIAKLDRNDRHGPDPDTFG
ncbi:MAG TPA: aldo/keto reductase [Segeticoccus sp.]|uniref:aldo/keto reductase n=1 Tax=Segeticoccus sp. TaxID=2706531 RepID=UPI002D7FD783|nr:aldo/keto reductase [Segeticoccus sp.]HET8601218.1 aldo/keto reductase [Segeticoccus sp.]